MSDAILKPIVKGPIDGNMFGIMAACSIALRRAGQSDKIQEMRTRITNSNSYGEALDVCMEYVQFDLSENNADDDCEDDA